MGIEKELVKLANMADKKGATTLADAIDDFTRHYVYAQQRKARWKKIGGMKTWMQSLDDEYELNLQWDTITRLAFTLEKESGFFGNLLQEGIQGIKDKWQGIKQTFRNPRDMDAQVNKFIQNIPQYIQNGTLNDKLMELGQFANQMRMDTSMPAFEMRGQAVIQAIRDWMINSKQDPAQLAGYLKNWQNYMPSYEDLAKQRMGLGGMHMSQEPQQAINPQQALQFFNATKATTQYALLQWIANSKHLFTNSIPKNVLQNNTALTNWFTQAMKDPQWRVYLIIQWLSNNYQIYQYYQNWLQQQRQIAPGNQANATTATTATP